MGPEILVVEVESSQGLCLPRWGAPNSAGDRTGAAFMAEPSRRRMLTGGPDKNPNPLPDN